MRRVLAVWAALLIAGPAATADDGVSPDVARYELGRRLKQFEAGWDKVTDPAARKRAVAELEKVHPQFLSLQFAEAARTLDRATHALRSDKPMTAEEEWAASLIVVPKARLVDGSLKELPVTVRQLYAAGDRPKAVELRLRFSDAPEVRATPDALPAKLNVPLARIGGFQQRDDGLKLTVNPGHPAGEVGRVCRAVNLAERVAALKRAAGRWKTFETIEQATVRDRAEVLADLLDGSVPETDLPAAGLLDEAEAMLKVDRFFAPARVHPHGVSVPLGGNRTAPVRLYYPDGLDPAKPVPVVVGLHGAGGTENLFFEGYGAGLAVKECEKRGWVFVATRGGLNFTGAPPVAEVLDQLAKRYPIDPKRAFLVGHSMGAAQAVRLAQQHPGRFAAVAALGGGGRVTDAKAFADLPVFVAAGEKDFGLGMARALNKSLTAGVAKNVTYKEYVGAEHLLIVREAVPDVFALFDKVAGG